MMKKLSIFYVLLLEGVLLYGQTVCVRCKGRGVVDCTKCNGKGIVKGVGGLMTYYTKTEKFCSECLGAGTETCTSCTEKNKNKYGGTARKAMDAPASTTSSNNAYSNITTNNKPFAINQPKSNNNGITQQQAMAQMQQTQNYIDEQNRRNQETTKTITNGIQELGNIWLNHLDKKEKEREAADERRRQREEENRIKEKEERIRVAEENRRREEAAAAERERQFGIDQKILGNVVQDNKPNTVAPNIKQVYYVIYERSYVSGKVNVKTYTLNKYSDGTWMLQSDMLVKINYKNYYGNDGITTLLGAYTNKQEAMALVNRIKANAQGTINSSFLELNGASSQKAAGTDKDFWNN